MLQSCALYWPEEYGYSEEYGPLTVELLSSSDVDPDVTIRIFKLSHLGKVMFELFSSIQADINKYFAWFCLHFCNYFDTFIVTTGSFVIIMGNS